MRKLASAGVVLAAVGAFVVVTAWVARPIYAQAPQAPVMRTWMAGGSRIGASVREVTADDLAGTGLDTPAGVVVASVTADSPAARGGLAAGDLVVEFDGERVRGVQQFARLVQETPDGRPVSAVVIRGGVRQSLTIAPERSEAGVNLVMPEIRRGLEQGLRDLPRAFEDFDVPFGAPRVRLGVELSPLNDQLAAFFGVDEGVLVSTVTGGSAAAAAGVRAGDVITAVDGRMVRSVADVRSAVADADDGASVSLTIVRDGEAMMLTAMLPDRPEVGEADHLIPERT